MSFGAQMGSSSQKQRRTTIAGPEWAQDYLKTLPGLAQQGPSAMTQQAQAALQDTVGGRYLTPGSNPYLAQLGDTIQRRSQENLSQSLTQANRASEGQGMLLSSANAAVKDKMARLGSQDVTDRLSQLYGSNYAQERQNQLGANNALLQQGTADRDFKMALAALLGNLGSSTTSKSKSKSSGFNLGL